MGVGFLWGSGSLGVVAMSSVEFRNGHVVYALVEYKCGLMPHCDLKKFLFIATVDFGIL